MEASLKKEKYKKRFDLTIKRSFLIVTLLSASIILVLITFILIKGITPFIKTYQIGESFIKADLATFLFSNTWYTYPNLFGAGFIIINTIVVVLLALLFAVPISVLQSLFIVRICPKTIKPFFVYMIELLAAVPSIIYGLFGMGFICNLVDQFAGLFGMQTAGGLSLLSSSIVLAIMIIPTISMLSMNAIRGVDKNLIYGSLALGASKTQTNYKVVLTSAKSGILSGVILGVGRALGEATAVSMIAGNRGSGPTFNLFDTTRTLTSTILLGLKETSGLDYDIRFSVGLLLLILILGSNLILNLVKRKIMR